MKANWIFTLMKKLLLILALTVFTICGFAKESGGFQTTNFGETVAVGNNFYHKVKIISVSDGVAELSTQEGDIKIPWVALPVDFQKRHTAEVEKLLKEQAARAEWASGILELYIQVAQNIKGGVLADKIENVITGASKRIFVEGISGVADDTRLTIKAKRDGLYRFTNVGGSNSTVEKWVLISVINQRD